MSKTVFERAFEDLSDAELATLMQRSRHMVFQEGAIIIKEGDDHGQIMVILDGAVRVVRLGREGKETDLTTPLGPGDAVGEMSFIDHMGASATLIAKTDVVVKSVDHALINDMKAQYPGFLERFYHSLLLTVIRRLRQLDYKMAFGGK